MAPLLPDFCANRDAVCPGLLGAVSVPNSTYSAGLSPEIMKGIVACFVIFIISLVAFRAVYQYRQAHKRPLTARQAQRDDDRGRLFGRSANMRGSSAPRPRTAQIPTILRRGRQPFPPPYPGISLDDNASVMTLPLYTPRSGELRPGVQTNLAEPRAVETALPWSTSSIAAPPPAYSSSSALPRTVTSTTTG